MAPRQAIRDNAATLDATGLAILSASSRAQAVTHRTFLTSILFIIALVKSVAAPAAIAIAIGDEHSAYDRLPALVGLVDRLKAENPQVPVLILIDGDAFEYGNRVARRTDGKIDLAGFRALARRAPTVLNIGNHETDLFSMSDLVDRVRATGVTVISGNACSRETGKPFAPASAKISIGSHSITVVGFTTDALATYRFAVRPTLDLRNPVDWANANLARELQGAELPIVLSHAGLKADRQILPHVPPGALFVGGHDHLRFVHDAGGVTYVHTGSWLEYVTIAELNLNAGQAHWSIRQQPLVQQARSDAALDGEIRAALTSALTNEDKRVVGHTSQAFSAPEAARFAVESARRAANADLAIIGATTFGDGLPVGDLSAYAFDNCVRFDGPLYVATISGDTARALLRRSNQGPDTPYAERTGENLIATTSDHFTDASTCRIVTTDWIGKNPKGLLGENAPTFTQLPGMTLKRAVIEALKPKL